MIKNYLKTALRNLWRNKSLSLLNIAGLSIGIACASLIFLWVEDELNYDSINEKKDLLYQVYQNQSSEGKITTINATPGPLAEGIREEIPGIRNSCRTTWQQDLFFTLDNKKISWKGLYADPEIFSMFSIAFIEGNQSTAFTHSNSIVITETMSAAFFGTHKNIVGKTLQHDNEQYQVSAVIKDLPQNSTLQCEWLAPFQLHFEKNKWLQYWRYNGAQTFVELEPGADLSSINKKLSVYTKAKGAERVAQPFLLSMNDWRLRSGFENGEPSAGRIQYVNMFSTIAWIILIIACINFMNLATASSEKRAKEVGVRKVIGAGRRSLILQFMLEALIISFISMFFALIFINTMMPLFNILVDKKLEAGLYDTSHYLYIILITLLCGLFAGSYPSLYLSSFKPITVLKNLKLKNSGTAFIRKSLVVVQFCLSIIFIAGTIIIWQQIQHIKRRPLGYDKSNLVQIDLPDNFNVNCEVIRQDLLSTGAVNNAAASMLNILYMGSTTIDFNWPGKDPAYQVIVTQDWVSPAYFSTVGMTIKEGRNFYNGQEQDSTGIIVNETLAKIIGTQSIIGKLITRGKKNYTIIGVASDIIYADMYGGSNPVLFLSDRPNYHYLYLRLNEAMNTEAAMGKIQTVLKKYIPEYSLNYTFVEDEFNNLFGTEMLTSRLSWIFAILAILISCFGLFGLATYMAERRTREIGVRKVLGASVSHLVLLMSADFLKLVNLAALLAIPLAWLIMNKWLQSFAYRIDINWWVFIWSGSIAILVALLTVGYQAARTAFANPVKNLRTE